jgi:hypothetical protein
MRYLLFGKDTICYASGGAHDILRGSDDLEMLIAYGTFLEVDENTLLQWWHIYDLETQKIVTGTQWQACDAPDHTTLEQLDRGQI